jgi:hypothetical protein
MDKVASRLGVPDPGIQQTVQEINQKVDDYDGHRDNDDDGPNGGKVSR